LDSSFCGKTSLKLQTQELIGI